MKKSIIPRKMGIYSVVATICLAVISSSVSAGLINTTYGYGYGYGYGNNPVDNSNKSEKTETKTEVVSKTSVPQEKKKKEKKKEKKRIKNSRNTVKKGEVLVQSGKGFKKNSKVRLYFSKPDGTFYPPVIVKTDSKGRFSVNYLVTKPEGKYKWYAVIPSSGKKTAVSTYRIVK
ncbi:MAG: hypothetical protein V3574_02945 [Candidatus Moraniibacteriota bacterium]